MLLKTIIVVLFIAVLVSLFSGLNFLVKDLGNSKRRLLVALGTRITLAALLLGDYWSTASIRVSLAVQHPGIANYTRKLSE